jgi:hypothetical protein
VGDVEGKDPVDLAAFERGMEFPFACFSFVARAT